MVTGLALLLFFNIAYASDKGAIIGGIAGGVICNEASKGYPVAIQFCTALGAAAGHELIDRPNNHRDQHHRDPERHYRPLPPPPPVYDGGWDRNRCDGIIYSRDECDQWQDEPYRYRYRDNPYCYGRYCRKGCQSNYWYSGDRICFKQGRIVYFPPSDFPCRKMVCDHRSDSCRCVERRRR